MLTKVDDQGMIEILEKKRKLFNELLAITLKQKELIETQEWSKLLNAINSKQLKIDKIDHLDERYGKLHTSHKGKIDKKALSPKIEAIFKEIETIAGKIDEVEKSNIKAICLMKEDLNKELKDIRVKKKVNSAYSQKSSEQKDGCFIDKHK